MFLAPGQVTELRALAVGSRRAVSQFFDREHVMDLARKAVEWERAGAKGVYFTPNPLRPEMLRSVRSANNDDVIERRWLLVDIDAIRPADVSSTDQEKAAAWEVVRAVAERMAETLGLDNPLVGDSGNGWHLCYPVRLPNDAASREFHRDLLRWLASECDTAAGKVDLTTHNASRIWRCYGTCARKGQATAERPQRWSRLIED